RWTGHVLEAMIGLAGVLGVLEANLVFHLGLLPSRALELWTRWLPAGWPPFDKLLGAQADVLFYAFLGPLLIWGLRAIQRRALFHRQGPRELVLGDAPYVHQILWLLARKLFSLSYGLASIKPYSASSQDELVLTHEPMRG